MIIEYHRPETLTDALQLLARSDPPTRPLGGGSVLSQERKQDYAVVDLQRLGLNKIETEGQLLIIGATVTLQDLMLSDVFPEAMGSALRDSLLHEASVNIRRVATMAGSLVSCDGRSPFVTALLALDPRMVWAASADQLPLGDFLPLRDQFGKNRLITGVKVPVNVQLSFSMVARSPMDRPVVCAAVATWPSGRTRVTLGGFGSAPILAMDGPESGGAVVAAREAYRFAGDDWASAAYRMEIAAKLVQRMLDRSN
jgi:CO/xanthine dehydrogenase FAD-binding subunit